MASGAALRAAGDGATTTTAGTWMFLLGSVELATRPIIRLVRYEHLRRLRPAGAHESGQDF